MPAFLPHFDYYNKQQQCVFSSVHSQTNHRCGLGITSFPLKQRTQVRSPVSQFHDLRFFRGFPSIVRQMSGNLGHLRHPVIIWPSYIIRLGTVTVSEHNCNTRPSLNNNNTHKLTIPQYSFYKPISANLFNVNRQLYYLSLSWFSYFRLRFVAENKQKSYKNRHVFGLVLCCSSLTTSTPIFCYK